MTAIPPALPIEVATLDRAALASGGLTEALLALNNAHAVELSWLEEGRLEAMIARAFWAGHVGPDAFVLTFDDHADYGSVNFQWFRRRFEPFVYVDRVVVAASLRGRGVARALYDAVVTRALAAGHDRVVCEVNVEPANEASLRLHEAMGFRTVGHGTPTVGKRVAYLELAIGPA